MTRILIKPKRGKSEKNLPSNLLPNAIGKIKDVVIIEVPDQAAERILANVKNSENVEFAEIDKLEPLETPPSERPLNQPWHYSSVKINDAWKISRGEGVKIAILDTGVKADHEFLKDRLLPGWNSVRQNTDWNDVNGHGTAVAGSALGMATDAKVMPIRVSDLEDGAAYNSDMARAIYWAADNGAHVLNMSYRSWTSRFVLDAVDYAINVAGTLVVSSAGNDGVDHGFSNPHQVVVVSASGQDGKRTWWSDYGNYIDVAAPGESVYTSSIDGGYEYAYGTSFSSPIVAGIAALSWRFTSLTELRERLKSTDMWNRDLGWGIVDATKVARPNAPFLISVDQYEEQHV